MKRFLSSDRGAFCLILLILVVMVVAAITGNGASRAELATPAPLSTVATMAAPVPQLPVNTPAPVIMYTIQDLNLRVAPGADQQRLSILPKGTSVELLGESQVVDGGTWVLVRTDDNEGWVNRRFLNG